MTSDYINKRLDASDIFNCKNLNDFKASIVTVLPYIGVSQSCFYSCEYKGVRFLTKICFYHKSKPELYGLPATKSLYHTDAEISILTVLNKRISKLNLSPCIIDLVFSKVCNDVGKITPEERICEHMMVNRFMTPADDVDVHLCSYMELVKNGLAQNKCAFLVLDKCDMSFSEFIDRHVGTSIELALFKSLLFQIIYTMCIINRIYPKFRHYDLHGDNILLKFDTNYKFKADNPKFLVFTMDNVQYNIPYFGIIAKIIDFGYSSLPEEGIVSVQVEDASHMFYRTEFDILLLFYNIYKGLDANNNDRYGRIDKILQHLEPNRSYARYHTEYIRKIADKIPSYDDMMNNKVWDEYRRFKITKKQIYSEYAPSPPRK